MSEFSQVTESSRYLRSPPPYNVANVMINRIKSNMHLFQTKHGGDQSTMTSPFSSKGKLDKMMFNQKSLKMLGRNGASPLAHPSNPLSYVDHKRNYSRNITYNTLNADLSNSKATIMGHGIKEVNDS